MAPRIEEYALLSDMASAALVLVLETIFTSDGGEVAVIDSTRASFLALAVVATQAPARSANWMASVPTPPEPAWISTRWPGWSPPLSNSACHAVSPASGMPAASACEMLAGLIARSLALTAEYSAIVPACMLSARAKTASPTENRAVSGLEPISVTTPETS